MEQWNIGIMGDNVFYFGFGFGDFFGFEFWIWDLYLIAMKFSTQTLIPKIPIPVLNPIFIEMP